ncbi:hypothetical protein GT037_004407 [Alternaria burnsii]|uniref:Uncharacterized protein n=1 Tax=Alternaria burnsii TaxID=1187904 RepID=A0A8H7B4X3_9PLEO|nr:uncharacterized protein GT037_004407 [Alternaria burnsii]KAF7677548.1 hypothetical protein GT037_004407 [Alternaria burnsii]
MSTETTRVIASSQDRFSRLPEEVTTRIMKCHYSNHIRGVLLCSVMFVPEDPDFLEGICSYASELHWCEEEERKYGYQPVATTIDTVKIQEVLKIRLVNKLFARCVLDAFFKSPIIFEHRSYDLTGPGKIFWFLPCQIEPKLVQRGGSIQAEYYTRVPYTYRFVLNKTDIHCVRTGMDLALTKQTHLPSITDADASLLANDIDKVFVHNPSGLTVRGIQFSRDLERGSFFDTEFTAKLVRLYWDVLGGAHGQTMDLNTTKSSL